MRKRAIVIVVLLLVLAAAGWWIYSSQTGPNGEEALEGSGTVEATEIEIASLVGGRIASVEASEGDTVEAGDVLFTIDAAVLAQQVEAAKASVRAAEAMVDQAEEDGSDAEVAAAKARADQARAQLRAAEAQLAYASVAAPSAGTVTVLAAQAGENAAPGRTLARIVDLGSLEVSVYVPETRIGEVALGDTARVTTDSSPQSFTGTVAFIASEPEFTPSNVETKEQRAKLVYEVRLKLSGGEGVLKPGMPVDATFE